MKKYKIDYNVLFDDAQKKWRTATTELERQRQWAIMWDCAIKLAEKIIGKRLKFVTYEIKNVGEYAVDAASMIMGRIKNGAVYHGKRDEWNCNLLSASLHFATLAILYGKKQQWDKTIRPGNEMMTVLANQSEIETDVPTNDEIDLYYSIDNLGVVNSTRDEWREIIKSTNEFKNSKPRTTDYYCKINNLYCWLKKSNVAICGHSENITLDLLKIIWHLTTEKYEKVLTLRCRRRNKYRAIISGMNYGEKFDGEMWLYVIPATNYNIDQLNEKLHRRLKNERI